MSQKKITILGLSDIGKRRDSNQDRIFYKRDKFKNKNIVLCFVADGLGGLKNGEVASGLVLSSFENWWKNKVSACLEEYDNIDFVANSIKEVIETINTNIFYYSLSGNMKCGTTLSLLFLYDNEYCVFNIGDSRIYKKESNQLLCITNDDTYVNEQFKLGKLTEEEVKNHPKRNVLTKCLGQKESVIVKFDFYDLTDEKGFLIFSDGFYRSLKDNEINMLFNKGLFSNYESKFKNLLESVLSRDGSDNTSGILIAID